MAYVYEMQFLALELPWEETLPPLLLPNFSILLYKKKKKKKNGRKICKLSQVVCGKLDLRFYSKNKFLKSWFHSPIRSFGMRT